MWLAINENVLLKACEGALPEASP